MSDFPLKNVILQVLIFLNILLLQGCAYNRHPSEKTEIPPEPYEFSVPQEKALGRSFLAEALKQYRFVKDPEITGIIQDIGRRIVEAEGADPDNYRFLVVEGGPVNAFAIPGGYIFFFDALIARFGDLNELAGVLAHEIAHVERNHFFQDQGKIQAVNLATLAAILLSKGNPAVVAGGVAANIDLQLRYSRENEAEADSYAIKYLEKAGFDPRSLIESLKTIAFYERFNRFDVPIYFSTHPSLADRQGHIDSLLRDTSPRRQHPAYGGVDWQRVQVSLLSKRRSPKDIEALVRGLSQPSKNEEREHYLIGVGYLKAGHCSNAIPEFKQAIQAEAKTAVYHADLAYCYLQMQDIDSAKLSAEETIRIDSTQPTALTVLGNIELHHGRPGDAIAYFKKALEKRPTDHLLFHRLGEAYGQIGDKVNQAYHLGRFLRLDLKPREALLQFRNAQLLVDPRNELSFKIKKEITELLRDGI